MKSLVPNLVPDDKIIMEKLLAAGTIMHKYAIRLQTVLRRANGKSVAEIAEGVGINRATVSSFINRYNQGGLDSLLRDKSRKSGTPPVSEALKNRVCTAACTEKPKDATHWSTRALAKRFSLSKSTVNNILRERGIKPHLEKEFRFSTDRHFEEKLTDVVGLYMKPPDNAIVLCVDEKSQIQALERSAPLLPLMPHVPAGHSADYYRHGTTTLFAALDMLTGKVKGECSQTHNSKDFIRFLKKLDKVCEDGKELHIIVDNYSAHKSEETKKYLAGKAGRFVLHFIPTHSSWLNMIERWFGELTNKRIRRESWESVNQLIAAIKSFIESWNESGRTFSWTKPADKILASIAKARQAYNIV
jgi:transposase